MCVIGGTDIEMAFGVWCFLQSWFSIELSAYHEVPEWGGQVRTTNTNNNDNPMQSTNAMQCNAMQCNAAPNQSQLT